MDTQKMIITNTGVYPIEVYDPEETVPETGKAYVRKDATDEDIFYLYRGKLRMDSTEPGIYIGKNELHEFIEPTENERENYVIKSHLAVTEPGDMLVVLKDKKNIQHVYSESSKLYIPDIEDTDNILKRALTAAFKAKEVSIEACKEGFTDRNAFFNFSSVMRNKNGVVSFLLFDRGCSALNLGYTIILHELDNGRTIGKSLDDNELSEKLIENNASKHNPLIENNSIDLEGSIAVSSEDTFGI